MAEPVIENFDFSKLFSPPVEEDSEPKSETLSQDTEDIVSGGTDEVSDTDSSLPESTLDNKEVEKEDTNSNNPETENKMEELDNSFGLDNFKFGVIVDEESIKVDELVPKNEIGEDYIPQETDSSYERREQPFENIYNQVNEDILGVKKGIPEGYPRIEVNITNDVPMTNRELKSLSRFLLGSDHIEEIESKNLIRVLMNIDTSRGTSSNYVGLISPVSLKTVLLNLKHHPVRGYYDENTLLEGKDLFALYMPSAS